MPESLFSYCFPSADLIVAIEIQLKQPERASDLILQNDGRRGSTDRAVEHRALRAAEFVLGGLRRRNQEILSSMGSVYNPDKCQSPLDVVEENFKRICEAYEILSDETKRLIYDLYGMEGLTS